MAAKTSLSILLGLICAGCQSQTSGLSSAPPAGQTTRNNCYSLLHQLLEEEKDVSLLRFIRPEQSDIKNLTKKIAAASKKGAEMLDRFAEQDASLELDDLRLPSGEVKTRDAIAATKKSALLSQKGEALELTLCLTQTEALNYGWHLAEVAARYDRNPERAQALIGLAEEMKNLYQEDYVLVLSKMKSSTAVRANH